MTLREPGPIPPAFDFTRFLVSSITFMAHLSEVSVYFDDKRLVRLSKDSGVPREVPMLKGLKNISPDGMMTVRSVQTIRESDCSTVSECALPYLYFVSSSHRSRSRTMGVHCRVGEIQNRCPKGCFPSNQRILFFPLCWIRRIFLSTAVTNASAGYTQGANRPIGGTFIKRCLDNLRC